MKCHLKKLLLLLLILTTTLACNTDHKDVETAAVPDVLVDNTLFKHLQHLSRGLIKSSLLSD